LRHCPPRPLQPLIERRPRKLAHSERLVFPRMTAPRRAQPLRDVAVARGDGAREAREPALVCIRSCVSMLSLISTGCRGAGRGRRVRAARIHLVGDGEGFGVRLEQRVEAGPRWSRASMRARYCSARPRAVQRPERIPSWSCARVSSSSSNALWAAVRAGLRDGARPEADGAGRVRAAGAAAVSPPRRRPWRGRRPRRSVGHRDRVRRASRGRNAGHARSARELGAGAQLVTGAWRRPPHACPARRVSPGARVL